MAGSTPPRSSVAGGALIALGAMGGAAVGFLFGEATPGFLVGIAAGIGMSLAIWAIDRQR